MYIYSFSNFTEVVKDKPSDKKMLLSQKINRSDNFINLTVLGAEQCIKEQTLPKDTSLYIASHNGNMNTTIKVLDSIFLQKRLPMPFNFLNTVNSIKLFYVAKRFELEGKAIFVDSFESALPQAFVDVKQGKSVLLGIVTEVISDLALHKEKFGVDEVIESSRWILLSPKKAEIKPIAKIEDFKIQNAQKAQHTEEEFFEFLEGSGDRFEFRGKRVSFVLRGDD